MEKKAEEFVKFVSKLRTAGIEVLGPAPAPMVKLKGKFRWRCLIKGREVKKLQALTREILKKWDELPKEGVRLEVDVDPQNLL